jgi:hypothetical protein
MVKIVDFKFFKPQTLIGENAKKEEKAGKKDRET